MYYHFTLLLNFIKTVVNLSLSCAERLRDRTKAARFESRVNSDSRPSRGPMLPDPPTLPPTPPVSEHHPPDVDTPLSSIVDIGGPVCRGQMPSGRPTFKDMPEELHCHILSFLSYNEIIRCASTCRTMYKTVKCSDKLQYIIELGAQGLIEVHPRPPTVSLPECLHILRNKANTWNTFRLNASDSSRFTTLYESHSIVHGNVFSFMSESTHFDAASNTVDFKIYTTCTARIWIDYDAVPRIYRYTYTDQLQDLEVIITRPIYGDILGFKYKLSFRTISTGEEHPLSCGSHVVSDRVTNIKTPVIEVAAAVLEDRLAVYVNGLHGNRDCWSLHVLNWQQHSQADVSCVIGNGNGYLDIRFLTKEKLIALSRDGQIHLYDIEDPSKAPQLQARFMLPVDGWGGAFDHPSIFHSAASCAGLAALDDHWIWEKNPADRVISVTWTDPSSIFIISARIFFMDIPPIWFDTTSKDGHSVPWSSWGPQNSRFFPGRRFSGEGPGLLGIGGSRVIWADRVTDGNDSLFHLHMTDFNPSAVARSIDNVFSQPTTPFTGYQSNDEVTTYLPFVEVIRDHVCRGSLLNIVLDEEKMAIITKPPIESEWRMQVDIFG